MAVRWLQEVAEMAGWPKWLAKTLRVANLRPSLSFTSVPAGQNLPRRQIVFDTLTLQLRN